MAAGRPITRRRYVHPNLPAGGVHAAAVTVTGTIVPNGSAVEIGWGANAYDAPSTWVAAVSDVYGGWSCVTVYPAAGTWYLWARSTTHPRNDEAVGTVVVT
jgi:hypothetical protein